MSKVLITDTNLTDIANAIRSKNGTNDTYKPSEMASAIEDITTGGGTIEKGLVINACDSNGYPTSMTLVGMTTVPNYYFYYAFHISENSKNAFGYNGLNKILYLPNSITSIGFNSFRNCNMLDIEKLPDSLTTINRLAFSGCTRLSLKELPSGLVTLDSDCFKDCTNLAIKKIPSGVKTLYSAFTNCVNLTEMTFEGDIDAIGLPFEGCTNLAKVAFPYVTKVPTLTNAAIFTGGPIGNKTGYMYVPNILVNDFKSASNWSAYASQICGLTLETIGINSSDKFNTYNDNKSLTIGALYNENSPSLYYEEQMGYTFVVESGNATITDGILVINDGVQVGDTITVRVTSTYDTSITGVKNIEVVYEEPYYEINLNDGQWVDSGTTKNGNVVYQSDAGSYHVGNGKSLATITVNGYKTFTLYIRSYAESNYDYAEAFAIDTPATRGAGKFTTKGKQSATAYTTCTYTLDGGTHTIDILYSKDGGGDNNDDRGYFYIGEAS